MLQATPTQPKFHKVLNSKVMANGSIMYAFKFNPRLFEHAQCRGIDTEVFYPAQEKFELSEERYITERLCGNCPVKEACLEWALVHERHGIWGGTTPHRRKFIRKAYRWMLNDPRLPHAQR
jgi:WhiB family transcriptional regulator, redox-sensing transcriptional regulator